MSQEIPDDNMVPLSEGRRRQEKETSIRNTINQFAYEQFADYFASSEAFEDYRTLLRQAQMSMGYHLYLSRALMYFVILSVVSILITFMFTTATTLLGVNFPKYLPFLFGGLDGIVLVLAVFLVTFTFSFILIAILPVTLMVLYPWYKADSRKREIETNLPYAVIFMYALSRGGTNIADMMLTVSESEDTYGEVANEFKAIVREIEYFDTDVRDAIARASRESPSSSFSQFTEDLTSIVESGGNIEKFLNDKADEFLEQKKHDQENFIEILALLGEVYVTAFVAGPLFVIVITTVMTLVSGGRLGTLFIIVYALIPLGNLLFAFLIDVLNTSDEVKSKIGSTRYTPFTVSEAKKWYARVDGTDSKIENLITTKKKRRYKEILLNPVDYIREKPSLTFIFTVPITIAYLIIIIGFGFVTLSSFAMTRFPVHTTTYLLVVPYLILATPFSIFYEIQRRRYSKIVDQLPSMVKKILNANETGMTLLDSFELASESMTGLLGEQLYYVKNEIEWRQDVEEALIRFSNKVGSSRLARTMKLLTKANEHTGNLTDVLVVAARDVTNQAKLDRDRKSQMRMYTVIIILSFLVYLFVIVMLNESFLKEIVRISQNFSDGGGSGQLSGQRGFNISNFPIHMYNMLFYHSALIQALGSGLIAGQMGSEDTLSGIKWTIILVLIAVATFMVFI